MQYRVGIKRLAIAVILSILTGGGFQPGGSPPAVAAPLTVDGVFNFLTVSSVNTIGRSTVPIINFGANTVLPNGAAGTTGAAQTTNLATGAPVTVLLGFVGSTLIPHQFGGAVSDHPNLRGPWTLTFRHGADTTTVVTPSLVGATLPPFASNVTISGDSHQPTFTWQFPAGAVDDVIVNLYDKSRRNAAGGVDAVFGMSGLDTVNSFTVPTVLAGGLSLQLGTPYAIAITGRTLRDPLGVPGNANTIASTRAFFDFTPLPSGAPVVNLPMVDAMGVSHYRLTVQAGQTVFIAPLVAPGYDYAIGLGDPHFQSVLLPTGIGEQRYNIYLFDAQQQPFLLAHHVPGGTPFAFGGLGVPRFRILGIETSAGLDPAHTTAFITGLTFVHSGNFTGTQTPLTTGVSTGSALSVFLPGLLQMLLDD
jgi:hypothetical protein